jgi:glycosidase
VPGDGGIGRRKLLRFSLLGVMSSFAAACTGGSPQVQRTPAAGHAPRFDEVDADVWADRTRVSGRGAAGVAVNGRPATVMRSGERFAAEIRLRPGRNLITATTPGNRSALVLTCRLPAAPVAIPEAEVLGTTAQLRSASRPNVMTQSPLTAKVWRLDGKRIADTADTSVQLRHRRGVEQFRLAVRDAAGGTASAVVSIDCNASPPTVLRPDLCRAPWAPDAIVYGVVPPLFGARPFEAVAAALPRLAALGVTVLWLAPVFACRSGDYGYEVTDLFAIRSDWGSEAQLKRLIEQAHAHGLKVILDIPLNDTSNRHPYFRNAQRFGHRSHYYDYYVRGPNGTPRHYFDWRWLPNLDYDNGEVRTMATQAALHWLERLEHDGYRVDAAWGVSRRRPDFWSRWVAEIRRYKPEILLIAEGSATEPVWRRQGFDVAYDWTHRLGQWAWQAAFRSANVADGLRSALSRPLGSPPMRFIDDSDTGTRFVAAHGPDMTRAAVAALMTLNGVPEIFTGSEIGARYLPYQRLRPLDWGADPFGLQAFYREMIDVRHRTEQLRGAGLRVLPSRSSADPVLAYRRWVDDPRRSIDVAVNFSAAAATAVVGGSEITLPAWGFHVG